MDINLKELSRKSGKTEFEIFKLTMGLLIMGVELMGIDREVIIHFPKEISNGS